MSPNILRNKNIRVPFPAKSYELKEKNQPKICFDDNISLATMFHVERYAGSAPKPGRKSREREKL